MTDRRTIAALALAAVLLGACQTEPFQMTGQPAGAARGGAALPPAVVAATPMDGEWAATDGVFVASFQGGAFTSRFTKTNEVLAQGTYSVAGRQVTMQWLSVATREQRAATCTMTGSNSVRCEQAGGGGFQLQRSA